MTRQYGDAEQPSRGHRRRYGRREGGGQRPRRGAAPGGVFCPLGDGDAGINGVIDALGARDYSGWLVIEQDQFLRTSDKPQSVIAGQRTKRE